ncbi:MAG: tetratricopeptide repeat protein [Pseudomonadota bacterium]
MINRKKTNNNGSRLETGYPVYLLLFVLILCVYYQTGSHDFVSYDDETYIVSNPHVLKGLTLENIIWAFTTSWASNWHPLTWMSHMLDIRFFGTNAGAHHFTNMLLHIMNAFLIFFLFRKMTGDYRQSCFLSVLFAIHPLHVESVTWVSERKDVLSTFCGLLALWSYVRYVETPGVIRYCRIMIFFVLSLMAKPMLVTLPFLLLLMDYWPLNRFSAPARFFRLWVEKIPLMIIAAASSIITIWAQQKGGAVGTAEMFPFWDRAINVLITYTAYIEKMIWPFDLAAIYPYPSSFPMHEIIRSGILLTAIFIYGLVVVKRFPYVIIGWLWYLGTLVPVIGLVQIGSQSMADRYTYVPLIGLFIMVSWGIPDLTGRWVHRKKFMAAGALIVCLCMTASAYIQTGYWKNSARLFQHTLDVTVDNWVAHNNLGCALSRQGRTDQAVGHFQEALRIHPEYEDARFNLGLAFVSQRRLDEAAHQFSRSLASRPDDKDAYIHLGRIFSLQNRLDMAIKHFSRAAELDPDDAVVYNNLGVLHAQKGYLGEAIFFFQKAVAIKPDFSDAVRNLKKARNELCGSVVTE